MADLFKPEYVEQARKLAALGATDREVAEFFEVVEATVRRWRHAHPEFGRALKLGKDAADERVEQSLYRRATGYTHDAVRIFQYQGQPVKVPYEEHHPPDISACLFWLKNRRREQWRERNEPAGKDGSIAISDLEIARRIAFLLTKGSADLRNGSSPAPRRRKPAKRAPHNGLTTISKNGS